MPAVAVTDTNNLFGVYEISDTLAKAGVQPIVGALLSVELAAAPVVQHGSRRKPPHLPLLVQNETGYRNLTKLLSAAYLDAEPGDWPHVKAGSAGGPCGGPDRADRRPGRAAQSPACWRASARRPRNCSTGSRRCSPTGSMSNCSATAWPRSAPPRTGLIDLAYERQSAAGRHQRCPFRSGRRCMRRMTRCSASPTAPLFPRTTAAG